MSVDSDASGADAAELPRRLDCGLCDRSVESADLLAVHCYADADADPPTAAAADGFVGVCADCADEVDELLAAWTAHEAPPVSRDHSIGAGYRRATDDCSFCDRSLGDGPVLGVERYRPADADEGATANYTLCGDCRDVFAEFLANVRG